MVSLILENLNCVHCAGRIEEAVRDLEKVDFVQFNFINKRMDIETKADEAEILSKITEIVNSIENGVNIRLLADKTNDSKRSEKSFIKKAVIRIILGALFFSGALLIPDVLAKIALYVAAYIVFGCDVVAKAFKNIKKGQLFDENFLMSIATIAAFLIGEFDEAVAVMFFYNVGEFFQNMAVDRSKRSVKELMSLNIESVNVIEDGNVIVRSPKEIHIGDIIAVKAGEKISVDGVITKGSTILDMKALTGESLPVERKIGDKVLSGSINEESLIYIRAEKRYEDSTVARILDMVENAVGKKSKSENYITKFAKVYTPIVVLLAALLAAVPILLGYSAETWIYRALVFLVSSCPCALVVSIPLTFFCGIGAASKKGVLIKGSNYLQMLSQLDAVAMDKTGTITKGEFMVTETAGENVLKYAASLERFSNHPIALAIVKEYRGEPYDVSNVKELSGYGITANIGEDSAAVGSSKLMEKLDISVDNFNYNVYVALNNKIIGHINVKDTIKEDSYKALSELKSIGVKNITMLTGDKKYIADEISRQVGIDNVYSELLPQDKVSKFEEICSQYSVVAAVGDGINDAPLLARADIGIAMGGIGSDAAIEAADVVIMDDMLSKIPKAVKTAKFTMKVCRQNVVFVVAIKMAVLILAAVGFANMWLAVFADVGTALLAVLNSLKIIKK